MDLVGNTTTEVVRLVVNGISLRVERQRNELARGASISAVQVGGFVNCLQLSLWRINIGSLPFKKQVKCVVGEGVFVEMVKADTIAGRNNDLPSGPRRYTNEVGYPNPPISAVADTARSLRSWDHPDVPCQLRAFQQRSPSLLPSRDILYE